VIIVLTIFLAARGVAKERLARKVPLGVGSGNSPVVSLPLSVIFLVAFAWAGYTSLDWPTPVRQFPLLIAIPGTLLSLVVVIRDLLRLIETKKAIGNWKTMMQKASEDAWLSEAVPFFGYLAGTILLTLLAGQKIAIPVFVGAYLLRWGHYSGRVATAYALGAWAILVLFYDQVMSLLFHPSYLATWLQPLLPPAFPEWLIF